MLIPSIIMVFGPRVGVNEQRIQLELFHAKRPSPLFEYIQSTYI